MEKIKNFLTKNAVIVVIGLVLFMLMQNCAKNRKITRLIKENSELSLINDSVVNALPSENRDTLLFLKGKLEFCDDMLDDLSIRKQTCGTFRDDYLLIKDQLKKEINQLKAD